jgi:DNA-directed RNA polymerase subunit alpha
LTLEVWTNGSIGPELAMVEAAKILRKHLNPFVQYSELGSRVTAASRSAAGGSDPGLDAKLNMTVADLRLSVRATNCLESENINTVRDLVSRSEDQLLEVRNFGDTTLKEVRDKLNEMNLRLGMRVPSASGV